MQELMFFCFAIMMVILLWPLCYGKKAKEFWDMQGKISKSHLDYLYKKYNRDKSKE